MANELLEAQRRQRKREEEQGVPEFTGMQRRTRMARERARRQQAAADRRRAEEAARKAAEPQRSATGQMTRGLRGGTTGATLAAQRRAAAEQQAATTQLTTPQAPERQDLRMLPSIAGGRGTTFGRRGNTLYGRGTAEPGAGAGVTGFASAAEQLRALREQNRGAYEVPGRETLDRGFRYRPSQWAQETARRNALRGFNATANLYRDPERAVGQRALAEQQLAAHLATDPRLQGLQREEAFQRDITADLGAATTQRGQDITLQGARDRDLSQERVAAAQQAVDLAQTRAELQRFGLERADRLAQQGVESRERNYAANVENIRRFTLDDDGNARPEYARNMEDLMSLSGAMNLPPEEGRRAMAIFDKFAEGVESQLRVERAGALAPLARIFSFFGGDAGPPQTLQQVYAVIRKAQRNPQALKDMGLPPEVEDLLNDLKI